jgi:spermidine/putrescine transport system substrate-binding protein
MSTFHPREARYGRRELIRRGAAGAILLSSAGTLLSACGGGDSGGSSAVDLQLARPDNPVTHPYYDDNPMIASGLEPESGTLRIYNWNGYLWPKIKKDFAKEYGVEVEETFFSTMDEAIAKISSGAVDFDVFFPAVDRLSRLVAGKLLQPLNREYLGNHANLWTSIQDPWYDKGSRYTVPYTIYTTGIGYRTDKVSTTPLDYDNPYDMYWDQSVSGKTYLLDDSRDAMAHMLLKNGITDINTEDPDDIALAQKELESLTAAVNVKLSTDDYTNLPEGRAWIHQMWSGSAISAQWYLPEGTGPEALGFWFPADGAGTIGNDLIGIPKAAKNPVLAHHFVNYLLDVQHGYDNFAEFVGYQPPFTKLDPDRLVTDEVVPANLKTAIVRESDFDKGFFPTELTPAGQTAWQNAWADFKAGM